MDPGFYLGSTNSVLCSFPEVGEVGCIIFGYGFCTAARHKRLHQPSFATSSYSCTHDLHFIQCVPPRDGRPSSHILPQPGCYYLLADPPSTTNTTMQPKFRSFIQDPHFLHHLKTAGNLPPLPIPRGPPDPVTRSRLIADSKMFFEAELFPRLPAQWIDYCMRVQMAYDRIHWVLETRSQGGWGTVYYGECITIERGLGILNQFVGCLSTSQSPLPRGS
jgi:hypothetical protein